MKFFCIGHFKTGTTSYSRAMRLMGVADLHFPPKYAQQLISHGVQPWALREWDSISNLHELEYAQCDGLYPGSKFVLTTRDVDKWLPSIQAHMQHGWAPELQSLFNARFQKIFGVPCRGSAFDELKFRRVFKQHDEAVREYFSADQLLVLDLDSGRDLLQELADFVGRRVTYPHINKRGKTRKPGEPFVLGSPYAKAV